MPHTVASSSTVASPSKSYHVFINHRGPDVKKTFASHLYHRLCSAHVGLRVFLDQPELRVGDNFPSQIKDAISTASVHVAIFSARYAESEWCLNELVYMLESKAPIIPVFYHVEPAVVRWPQGKGVYAEALRIIENKKTHDPESHEEKPRYDPATIRKWRQALSSVSEISGLDLQGTCNGDEGALVEKIVQRVLEKIQSILSAGISDVYCSGPYGGIGGRDWSDGTYSGVRRITMTQKGNVLISIQLCYGLEGDESVEDKYFSGLQHGGANGAPIVEFKEFYSSEIYGGCGGSHKSDGTYSGIRRITMTHKGNLLTSVQVYYGLEGDASLKNRSFPGLRHGGGGGASIEYNLNYPQEIVTKITGYFGSYKPWPLMIKSLTFHTNQRKLGPCGQEQGTHFETKVRGKIVGIFTSSGAVVDSIGVVSAEAKNSEDGVSEGH